MVRKRSARFPAADTTEPGAVDKRQRNTDPGAALVLPVLPLTCGSFRDSRPTDELSGPLAPPACRRALVASPSELSGVQETAQKNREARKRTQDDSEGILKSSAYNSD